VNIEKSEEAKKWDGKTGKIFGLRFGRLQDNNAETFYIAEEKYGMARRG